MTLMEYVLELEGKSDEERKDTILRILEEKGYEYDIEKFNLKGETGSNIILEIGGGKREILLISHYDAFQGSPGANDNASGIAVSMDVYRRLLAYKKNAMFNGKVKVIFFGKEEPNFTHPKGRIGSKDYVEKHKDELQSVVSILNLELCGAGDMIGIWPVANENKDSKVLEVIKKAIEKINIYYETTGKLPGVYADYKSFTDAGFADAFCFTAVKKEDKDNLRLYAESLPIEIGIRNFLGILFKNLRVKMPELLMHHHNSEDKSSHLSEASLRMMSDAIFNVIVNLDKKFSKGIEEF